MYKSIRQADGTMKRLPTRVAERIAAGIMASMVVWRVIKSEHGHPFKHLEFLCTKSERMIRWKESSGFPGTMSSFYKKGMDTNPAQMIIAVAHTLLDVVQIIIDSLAENSTMIALKLSAWLKLNKGPMHPWVRDFLIRTPSAEITRFTYCLVAQKEDITRWLCSIQKVIDSKQVSLYAVLVWVKASVLSALLTRHSFSESLLNPRVLMKRDAATGSRADLWKLSEIIDKGDLQEDQILEQQSRARTMQSTFSKQALRQMVAPMVQEVRLAIQGRGKDNPIDRRADKPVKPLKPDKLADPAKPFKKDKGAAGKGSLAMRLRAEMEEATNNFGTGQQLEQLKGICVYFASGQECRGKATSEGCTWTTGGKIHTAQHICFCGASHALMECSKWKKKKKKKKKV